MSELTDLLSDKSKSNSESIGILTDRNPVVQSKIDLFLPICKIIDTQVVAIAASIVSLQTEIVSLAASAYAVGCGTTAGVTTVYPDVVRTSSLNVCTSTYDGDSPYNVTTSTLSVGNIGIGTLLISTQNDSSQTGIGSLYGSVNTCFRTPCVSGTCVSFASSITTKQSQITLLRNQLTNLVSSSNKIKRERVEYEIERFGNNYAIRILNEENVRISLAIDTINSYP
jgi:hypothetical protein